MKTGTHPAPRRPGFPPAREGRLCKGLLRRASRCLAGHSSREASTPCRHLLGEASTLSIDLPGESSIPCRQPPSAKPPQPTVMPAEAGIQGPGGALYSGGTHTLLGEASIPCGQPLRGGRHSLPSCPRRRASSGLGGTPLGRHPHPPSTPSWRPPQPTVMPTEGDLCVTPPVGDSVAEMASIPSGEPHPWIPACAGMTVVQRSPEAGTQWSGGALLSGGIRTLRQPPWRGHPDPAVNPFRGGRHSLPSCPRKETFA